MTTCPWSLRWTWDTDARCEKPVHLSEPVAAGDDMEHEGAIRNFAYAGSVTKLSWMAGDRREFTGTWPGPCTDNEPAGCILHTGHHGRHAP